ncbi:hypothetical protein HYG79_07110 [Costertonia aggregata]|uniref:Uncharacterized protein n=2 Tax=Costertonia aggregata TaxID=343403 RepID=A0A7H9AUV4_9FLAO|nr:hypothetical protein HYG79_07110 [Costertonia aggregata]
MAQKISGEALLDKAIAYHDPNNHWNTLKTELTVTMTSPDTGKRVSNIIIDFPNEYFSLIATRNGVITEQILHKDDCRLSLNEDSDISKESAKKYRLTCERARMMKDYYTYLYGLPMKLKDPGTKIHPDVQQRGFKGKQYLVLKAEYEAKVGNDIWYFYFDPKTYAMKVYQFFHDEEKNDGEYILLKDEEIISDIKMPKTREWYYNLDDTYLGTDVLSKHI